MIGSDDDAFVNVQSGCCPGNHESEADHWGRQRGLMRNLGGGGAASIRGAHSDGGIGGDCDDHASA